MITDSMMIPLLAGVVIVLLLGSLILVSSAHGSTRRSSRRFGHSYVDNQPGGCAWTIVTVLSIVVIALVLTWLRVPFPPVLLQTR